MAKYTLACANYQAINKLAEIDENRQKIMEAGALWHYYELLNPERRDECVREAATHGIYMLRPKGINLNVMMGTI